MLGSLGIVLPLLPTTPFLLLASWLFYKGSPELRHWLLEHKILGRYIKDYLIYKSIPLRSKIITIVMMWATMLASIIWVIDNMWMRILLGVVGICVTIHLMRIKTRK